MGNDSLLKQIQIKRKLRETLSTTTFVLQPLNNWRPNYKAGQFLTILFKTISGEKRRSYSISSSPDLNEELSITVKSQENGEFSRWLLEKTSEGDILTTIGISGFFLLPNDLFLYKRYVFFAAGSGITPCFSMIKTILRTGSQKVVLIYSSTQPEETIFFRQLNKLAESSATQLTIHYIFSRNHGSKSDRLNNDQVVKLLNETPDKVDSVYYLCGPHRYMQMVSISLIAEGVPEKNIKKENFNDIPVQQPRIPADTGSHAVTIKFLNEIFRLSVPYPMTILEAAKARNIGLPYSCEAGRCGSCAARCISGKIYMGYNEVLTEKDEKSGLVLTCQGYPLSDAELEF